jgi:hypothetical protein
LLYSFFHDFHKSKAGKKNNDAITLVYQMLEAFEDMKKLEDERNKRAEA